MNRKHTLCRAIPILALGAGLVAAANAGDADRGAAVYYQHGCYSCHGYGGVGRTPLANSASGILVSEDVFLSFLRQREDLNPVLPANSMPNYGVNALSDGEASDVYAYLKTLVDSPPSVDDIPAFVELLKNAERNYEDN